MKPVLKGFTMYEGIHNIQQFADTVKSAILDMARLPKKQRLDGLRVVSDLERCGWHPAMMTDAVRDVMGDTDNGWAFLEGEAEIVLNNIENVIQRYLQIFGCDGGDALDDVYDVFEAADYLGISIDGFKYHYNREKNIKGVKKRGGILFTRAQLDAFKNRIRK
jgi:hypothetical protein